MSGIPDAYRSTLSPSPYRLFLDIQTVQTKDFQYRGIPRYVVGHALALIRHGDVAALGLNPVQAYPRNLDPELARSALLTWTTAGQFRRRNSEPLAYHIMSPFETVPDDTMVPEFLGPGNPLVLTLYDLIPLIDPDTYLWRPEVNERYRNRLKLIQQADLVLTISESTRDDGLRLLDLDPERVVSIGSGVSGYFGPPAPGESPEELIRKELPKVCKPFVACVAGADERKNVDRLIQAYASLPARLRDDLQLVVTCQLNDEWRQRWHDRAASSGLKPGELVLTDLITDDVLLAAYQSARLFVFPSTYEGFGLPAAEAAACGCPTITSNTSSMPEILNFAEATFDPMSPDSIASTMHRALTDSSFNAALRRAAETATTRHSWQHVAERTIEALKRLPAPALASSNGKPRPAGAHFRMALVGPFPPIRSGIADYNLRLAGELSRICHLDLFGTEGSDLTPVPGTRMFPLAELGESVNPGAYDAIVYTFGNSDHHHLTLDKATEYPGLVWFHDVRLAGFYISYGVVRAGPEAISRFIADKLDYFYRNRLPAALVPHPSFDMEVYDHYGLGLTVELAQDARGAIVNSEFARHLLAIDQGPFLPVPPTAVLPLAIPDPPPGFTEKREELLVGTFGIGGMHKAPDLVIEAVALLRQRVPGVRLVFVGPCEHHLSLKLQRLAADSGIWDAVQFTGEVDEQTYWDWLGRVTCAVQVRSTTHGESSAGLNDCLATGTPAVTNLIACRELPEGVVDLLPAEIGPEDLAVRLELLLTDPDLRAGYSAASRRWAAKNTFGRVAHSLVEQLTGMSS
jgi:glycosyltransferase involved in cell wall biosynthesis